MGKKVKVVAAVIAATLLLGVFARGMEYWEVHRKIAQGQEQQEKQCRETPADHPFHGLICGKKFRHTPPKDMAPPERTREEKTGSKIYKEFLGEDP